MHIIIEPIFDKAFIYDSHANRKGKGNLFALKRFYAFSSKISENEKTKGIFNKNQIKGYCLKADIKHYFEEINHGILLAIVKRKIKRDKTKLVDQTNFSQYSAESEREADNLIIKECHLEI